MKAIALVQTTSKDLNQLQQNISQSLNPILNNQITQGTTIIGQVLKVGQNTINHGLGYALTGYLVVGANAPWSVYDNQAKNSNPSLTLLLVSQTAVTVNLYCY